MVSAHVNVPVILLGVVLTRGTAVLAQQKGDVQEKPTQDGMQIEIITEPNKASKVIVLNPPAAKDPKLQQPDSWNPSSGTQPAGNGIDVQVGQVPAGPDAGTTSATSDKQSGGQQQPGSPVGSPFARGIARDQGYIAEYDSMIDQNNKDIAWEAKDVGIKLIGAIDKLKEGPEGIPSQLAEQYDRLKNAYDAVMAAHDGDGGMAVSNLAKVVLDVWSDESETLQLVDTGADLTISAARITELALENARYAATRDELSNALQQLQDKDSEWAAQASNGGDVAEQSAADPSAVSGSGGEIPGGPLHSRWRSFGNFLAALAQVLGNVGYAYLQAQVALMGGQALSTAISQMSPQQKQALIEAMGISQMSPDQQSALLQAWANQSTVTQQSLPPNSAHTTTNTPTTPPSGSQSSKGTQSQPPANICGPGWKPNPSAFGHMAAGLPPGPNESLCVPAN